ncbi:MAG: LemA family protein [Steroidobacteraceae bacterium]
MAWIVLVALVIAVGYFIGLYNGLVTARNAYQNAFAQIDVQLSRRYDLIPNLVETARAYMQHERATLEAVITARNSAVSGLQNAVASPANEAAIQQLASADTQLGSALGRLLAVAEAYPELKANQNMLQLNEELSSTENKVAFARQAYNDSVMFYNTRREVFPASMVAGWGSFLPAHLLPIESIEKRAVPKVSFS